MKKIITISAALAICAVASAQTLSGFKYADVNSPDGSEWQDPQQYALNKQQPHAWFFSFTDKDSALKILPENSSLWQSLNGTWKFNWVGNPSERPTEFYKDGYDTASWDDIEVPSSWNVKGIGKDGSLKYGQPIYINVNEIFYLQVKPGDWKNGVMRTPPENWSMYKNRNEVGSYKRTFTVPDNWAGDDIFINFDGVDSFFYLWINGKYVGFSKNSRNLASFDITKYLKKGENSVAVEVYRNSDGSFLECQDMFRLPGIFRTVALEAKPKAHVRDFKVTPGFTDEARTDGTLDICLETVNVPAGATVNYSLYQNALYSDETTFVASYDKQDPSEAKITVKGVSQWSAEAPNRYTLVGELKDASGKTLDIFSTITGFRDVSIHYQAAKDDEFGLGGRYFFVNGKTVKLKGVNRHENEPSMGHAITRDVMQEDLFLMKRANLNHVRDCHYPDDPYWYFLCDKYGIYLMDEANIESHEYRYGAASLSHVEEFKDAHVDRMMEMVEANYNHPSIVIWSMGNEAGPGQNFVAVYDAAKAYDQSRPVQYERNNNISDIGCCQYPSIEWVNKVATGQAVEKYPYHINEYAHSMGNALGNFEDYWAAFESTNFFMGGAIWDWVDQNEWYYTKDGQKYLAYGGDFGDFPNDGQFEMNGVIFGDRSVKPEYFEVKKVLQYVRTSYESGKLTVFNKNYFEPASYYLSYNITAEGETIADGEIEMGSIAPRTSKTYDIPAVSLPAGKECFLNVDYRLIDDLPWARAGYTVAWDQFKIQDAADFRMADAKGTVKKNGNVYSGKNFEMTFDPEKGTIEKLVYGKQTVIPEGCGPVLNPIRAFVNNDNWAYESWFKNGLNDLQFTATDPVISGGELGSTYMTISQTVTAQAPCSYKILGGTASGHNSIEAVPDDHNVIKFTMNQKWTVYADGRIVLESDIDSDNHELVLARLGYEMKITKDFANLKYYGRGPEENYNDRAANAMVGLYGSTVAEQVTHYTKPQDMSNHEDVRWMSLTGKKGGVKITALANDRKEGRPVFSMCTIPYSVMDLIMAPHMCQLPEAGDTYVNIDAVVTGLGGNSCGQGGPLDEDCAFASPTHFSFMIEPVK